MPHFARPCRRPRTGAKVLVLERAPQDERGGNTAYTEGLMRFVYNGAEDILALSPDLSDEEKQERFRHLHRGCLLRRHGARHGASHRSGPLRNSRPAEQCDRALAKGPGLALPAAVRAPVLQGRRPLQVLGRRHARRLGGGRGMVDSLFRAAERPASPSSTTPGCGPDLVRRRRARRRGAGQGETTSDLRPLRRAGLRRLRGQRRVAHALSRAGLGSRQGARLEIQHR